MIRPFRRFLLRVLKGKLIVMKSDVALYCTKEYEDLENELLFDLDTMIDKINYFLEV